MTDCDTRAEAFDIANHKNRNRTSPLDNVYYVSNDTGAYIRGVNRESGDIESREAEDPE